MTARQWCELVVFIAGCLVFGYVFAACAGKEKSPETFTSETLPANLNQEISVAPSVDPNADFSKFKHSNAEHARFPCALCHERKDNSPTPKLVGHIPCASCHTAQFADKNSAICTICHTNTETAAVKSFPPLKSHTVVFDHAKHLRQTNCATCHKGNGAAMTIPAGFNAHNACFTCHTPDAQSGEKNISSCSVCHRDGNFVKVSDWTKTYQATPFSHNSHRLECAACHSVKAGSARGSQVSAIIAKMHFPPKNAQSCASCHNNQKAFGGDDFQDCRRCHRGNNFKFS